MNIDFFRSNQFIMDYWRKREPVVFRKIIPEEVLESLKFLNLKGKLTAEVAVDAYFSDFEYSGKSKRIAIPDGNLTLSFMNKFNRENKSFIFYLFNLHKHHEAYKHFADELDTGYGFRYYANLVSISNRNSLIPAHIDFIDSLVVQIEGSRSWKVWDKSVLDMEDLRLVNKSKSPPPEKIRMNNLVLDVVIEPGDVLYLPALFGHEGETHDNFSLSYSQGWTAYSVFRLLDTVASTMPDKEDMANLLNGTDFYLPIPDEQPDVYHPEYFYFYVRDFCKKYKLAVDDDELKKILLLDFRNLYKPPQ